MNDTEGKSSLLQNLSCLRAEHVELICRAIDQQAGLPHGDDLPHLGKLSRRFDRVFNPSGNALEDEAARLKATLYDLFETSKSVQVARGDLTRASLDDAAFTGIGEREEVVKGVIRSLKDMGVYVDGVHHCIGLQINPPRRKPRSEENQPLQEAVTALAVSSQLSPEAREYYDSVASQREAGTKQPALQR